MKCESKERRRAHPISQREQNLWECCSRDPPTTQVAQRRALNKKDVLTVSVWRQAGAKTLGNPIVNTHSHRQDSGRGDKEDGSTETNCTGKVKGQLDTGETD